MKFRTYRKVKWSYLELTGLVEDEESHVHFTRTTKHLALHPYYLNNIQQGLNQILRSSLNSYDKELKGFVLAFKNPKLLSNVGEMLYDSPFIHIDIEADFYLFRPTVGSFLKGIVNKKGLDHVILLVHKIYTVSIPKPDNAEEWPGELVEIGQEVKCYVNQIDNKSKPPFICATLRSDYSQGCKLPESINNIDNVDSAIESANSTMRIDASANGISEDDVEISEKERKKHRKKHKSRESNSEFVCKVENELNDNIGNDTSRTIKLEKKQQYQSMQALNTDDSLNNSEVDNIPKKHKKSKKTSKSFSNDTILDEHTERKAVKRENSIPLDSITETETKKRKKHSKKSKISDSESEGHSVKIKIEKQDPFIDGITNESQVSCSETQVVQNLNETFEMPKFIKREGSIKNDTSEKERKKSPKRHTSKDLQSKSIKIKNEDDVISDTSNASDKKRKKKHTSRDSQLKSVKIKNEDDIISVVSNVSDEEGEKSPKKHANLSRGSDPEIRIKSEDITNDISDIFRSIKPDPEEFQYMKYNTSATDNNSSNSDLDHTSKKVKKKKKTTTILSDSELKSPVKIKTEKV